MLHGVKSSLLAYALLPPATFFSSFSLSCFSPHIHLFLCYLVFIQLLSALASLEIILPKKHTLLHRQRSYNRKEAAESFHQQPLVPILN